MLNDILQFYPSENEVLSYSEGCNQYDLKGKKYLDFESGVWCANLGHNHPEITRVIQEYAQKSLHSGYRFRIEEAERLSIKLQLLAGIKNGAAFFLSSGSEAVNLSISLARYLTGRKKILKIHNSYLSAYGFGRIAPDNADIITVKYNDLESIRGINYSEISALVLELGGASVDVVQFPDNKFIEVLVAKAKENNCFVIAEEVTTGIGRLGKWFGFEHYNVKPDMVVAGKALGNGYPISALLVDEHVKNSFNANPFVYGQSHQNDPMACAVGLTVIDVIEKEGLLNKSIEIARHFEQTLEDLKEKHSDKINDVRSKGLMLAIEFQDKVRGKLIVDSLYSKGFIVGFKKNTIRLMPPLVIRKQHIEMLVKELDYLLR